MRRLLFLALASCWCLACKNESAPSAPAASSSAAPSHVASAASTTASVASASAPASASVLPPFVPPPPAKPSQPIVAKAGEALVTAADCAAFDAQYSKIMSGFFDEPAHATCGPKSELVEARKEMLPIFAEQARALRADCDAQIGWRYDKADAACFLRAKSTADWRACEPRTPFFADAIGAVPYACEAPPKVEPKAPDADPTMLSVRTAPRVLRSGDCDPLASEFVEDVRARASAELARCKALTAMKGFDEALAGVRNDVVKECKAAVGGVYAGRDRLCFDLSKTSAEWGACRFSTPLFRAYSEIASKLEETYSGLCPAGTKPGG